MGGHEVRWAKELPVSHLEPLNRPKCKGHCFSVLHHDIDQKIHGQTAYNLIVTTGTK